MSKPTGFSLAATVLVLAGTLTTIQTMAQGISSLALEERVVSARKKLEPLQDVPMAISVFTPEAIKNNGFSDIQDLQQLTPSLNIFDHVADTVTPIVALRGQVQNDSSVITLDPAVGIYINGVYQGRAQAAINELFDIAAVEVLRGPQGTLYGRNTTGGAIRIDTVKAEPGMGVAGHVMATAGNYNARIIEGAVNLPLTDDAAIRLSARNNQRDGWSDQVIMDQFSNISDTVQLNAIDSETYRMSVVWRPTDSLHIEAGGDRWDANDAMALLRQNGGDMFMANDNRFTQYSSDLSVGVANYASLSSANNEGYYISLENEFESFAVKTILAHRQWSLYQLFDLDATSYDLGLVKINQSGDQDSIELQFYGDALNENLEWMLGLYYFVEDGRDDTRLDMTIPEYVVYAGTADSQSESIFGHLVYAINDEFSVQLGLRYTRDEKGMVTHNVNQAIQAETNPLACPFGWDADTNTFTPSEGVTASATECTADLTKDYSYLSWTVGLDWSFASHAMAYIKSNLGQRSGGHNFRGAGDIVISSSGNIVDSLTPFDEEKVLNTELGINYDTPDYRGRINVAYFHTEYSDYQYSEDAGTTTYVHNLDDASIDGFEIEASYLLAEGLVVSAMGSYLDFEYDEKLFQQEMPTSKYAFSLNYTRPQNYGEWVFATTYSYTDRYKWVHKRYNSNRYFPDSYKILNARAELNLHSGLGLAVYGNNLTDEKYLATEMFSFTAEIVGDSADNFLVEQYAEPRMYGVELNYVF